jgi:hypothetical protein
MVSHFGQNKLLNTKLRGILMSIKIANLASTEVEELTLTEAGKVHGGRGHGKGKYGYKEEGYEYEEEYKYGYKKEPEYGYEKPKYGYAKEYEYKKEVYYKA